MLGFLRRTIGSMVLESHGVPPSPNREGKGSGSGLMLLELLVSFLTSDLL